jgi:hypothetical protein
MQIMLAEVMLDDRCQLDRALRIAEVDRAMAALDATPVAPALSARAIVLSIRRDLMHGNFDTAQANTFSFAIDPSVAIEARATALKALLAAYEGARRPLALSPEVASELRARGELWWPELRSWFRPLAERIAAMDDAERASAADVTFAAIGPLLAPLASKDGDSAWRVRLATALVAAGRDALTDTTIDRLFPASESHTVPALLVRANARLERGDGPSRDEAMRLFREAATLVKEESPLWWEAELGQLRVAAASPGTADAVRARIHWLRSLDTTLGGAAIGPRIEALLRSLPDR